MSLQPLLSDPSDLLAVLLQIPEMPIPLDPNLRQLDPFWFPTCLPQIIQDAMIVRRVLRRLSGNSYIRYAIDLR